MKRCYTVYTRYGFEGAMLSIYGFDRPSLDCPDEFCPFKTPSKFLKVMDMNNASYWLDFGVLLGFFLVIRFVTFFILRWKLRSYVWSSFDTINIVFSILLGYFNRHVVVKPRRKQIWNKIWLFFYSDFNYANNYARI